jgi:hypothetical protein
VSELLERVRGLASADEQGTVTRLYLRNISSSGALLPASASGGSLELPPEPQRLEGETVKVGGLRWGYRPACRGVPAGAPCSCAASQCSCAGQMLQGQPPSVPRAPQFHRVYLSSPDGGVLVRELSFEVQPGRR